MTTKFQKNLPIWLGLAMLAVALFFNYEGRQASAAALFVGAIALFGAQITLNGNILLRFQFAAAFLVLGAIMAVGIFTLHGILQGYSDALCGIFVGLSIVTVAIWDIERSKNMPIGEWLRYKR